MNTILSLCFSTVILIFPLAASAQDIREDEKLLSLYFDMGLELEQKVEAATRVPKSLNQVAENVTIITAADIERMNAHNVDDILNRVAGIYVNYIGLDFNNNSLIYIQGSNWEHVVVLLDGVRVNKASVELAWVNMIPVRIIKRIEVIKGAASSVWGSALGGVINIITKDSGDSTKPQVDVVASYGGKKSHDVTAELTGKTANVSYYLYAGSQDSDGLQDDRFYENSPGYGKLRVEMPHDMTLEISGLYSQPKHLATYWPAAGHAQELNDKNTFISARFDALLAEDLNLHAEVFRFDNDYQLIRHTTSLPTTLIHNFINDQKSTGGAFRLDYKRGDHTLVAGADYQRNEIQMTWKYRNSVVDWDPYYPLLAPMGDYYAMDLLTEDISGYYLNGSFVFDRLTVSPGLRWDHISTVSNELISPSLGVTYQIRTDTLLRASVSKGFRKPPAWHLEGDPLYSPSSVNPYLDPEKNWTYQAGAESMAIPYLHIKTTLFHHDVDNTWVTAPDWSIYKMNGDPSQRQGLEVQVQTRSIYHTSLQANVTYTYSDLPEDQTDHSSTANIILLFDHPEIITAELSGHYLKWGRYLADGKEAKENNSILWNLSINRTLYDSEHLGLILFGVARNIFNTSQYTSERGPNAPRYAEIGLKMRF